ncbi:23S rRNA pseudouridine2605 synthase [Bathymodiolus japonicus methanotrophic gill symbiont]|nr:23S rRNA pseudouridine2605 synthase [Bathymodiolus japonicus methanotrophic gill symbiont]
MKTQAPVINIKPYAKDKESADTSTQTVSTQTSDNKLAGERIQKVLARGGVGSRREVERWITEGLLTLNGQPVSLGDRLKAGDNLILKGRPLKWEKFRVQPTRVLIYHKPTGEVVTRNATEDRPVVFKKLPKLQTGRWIAVGRLDINTQGLLLLTNNGELANRLMHPSSEIDREYAVRILGEVSDDNLAQLKKGVQLEDGVAKFDDIQFNGGEGANRWYHVTVKEGRNRLVRRLWEALEFQVSRLMRVRYGPIFLPDGLSARQTHELTTKELDDLLTFVDLPRERFEHGTKSRSQTQAKAKSKTFAKPGARSDRRPAERNSSVKKPRFDKNRRPRK